MYQFQLQITKDYAPYIVGNHWVNVNYEVVDNRVVITSVELPHNVLRALVFTSILADDIYLAAENNAGSMGYIKTVPSVFVQIFDQFKL